MGLKDSAVQANKKFLFILLLLCSPPLLAQELSGYVSAMPSLAALHPGDEVWWQTLAHNRLTFGWQMADTLRADVGMRNRFLAGSEAWVEPQSIRHDGGWVHLSWNWAQGRRVVGNTSFDRLSLTFEKNQWKLQAGRQRINWGHTFVWNPNNIFNTHSFFDFDYPERPGADALRLTCFHDETSSSELALSFNDDNKATAALLHRWNWDKMDFQLMAGTFHQSDFVLGGAWTGDFKGLNIRSEFSYFLPLHPGDSLGKMAAVSLGVDYMFANALQLLAEVLFNNATGALSANGPLGLYSAPLSAKALSLSRWNVFAQALGPLTPRLNASVSAMYMPDIKSWYTGFSLEHSLSDNVEFSFHAQLFAAAANMRALLGFARLKYSF